MVINVLGQEYEIQFKNGKECPKLELLQAHGIAELYDKKLIIDAEMNSKTGKEFDNFNEFENKVVRHEIMHAFFHEAGLRDYCEDETLVDWLALQIPKISKVMQEHNLL